MIRYEKWKVGDDVERWSIRMHRNDGDDDNRDLDESWLWWMMLKDEWWMMKNRWTERWMMNDDNYDCLDDEE